MRIGFDMLAVQSPHHGHRGIGRYSRNLVATILERHGDHDYVLYAHEELPSDRIPSAPNATLRWLRVESERGESTVAQYMDRLARENPDELDLLVILSPFENWLGHAPPARPDNGLKLVTVLYDMIPFLFPREFRYDAALMRYYRALDDLRRYDALLCISESTRRDGLALLPIDGDRFTNISAASDGRFFVPDHSEPMPETARRVLDGLKITRPFVLNVGGLDDRKNTWSLIHAFASLPPRLRRKYQLVLTFTANRWGHEQVKEYVEKAGLKDELVMTNEVTDEALRVLYQRCAAFAYPSLYEGFGLPLLEAMQCGAAVVAGNNSSQPEVVGAAGLLANNNDPTDIAAKLLRVLEEPGLARHLGERAVEQAREFGWEQTADQALEVCRRLTTSTRARQIRFDHAHRPRARSARPRIAFFSPFPPQKSGISDYSIALIEELKRSYEIDLYHDPTYVPDLALRSDEFWSCDARLFPRYAAAKGYHAAVYQMGNSRYHTFLYETMLRYPGVVTLHDFCLAGFHLDYGHKRKMAREYIRNELLLWYPVTEPDVDAAIREWDWDWLTVARGCARRGWYLNRRLIDRARRVVVHSPWCREQIRAERPDLAAKMAVIPHGTTPRRLSAEQRAKVRARFEIPRDALVVASFGFLHPEKLSPEALDAFRPVAERDPSALFVFVGEDTDGGSVRRYAEALGLLDRVRFLGRQPLEEFADLAGATDVGINLRRPPTNGETSGALLHLLAAGVATVVTDVATFADYPDQVVRKVRWDEEGPRTLGGVLAELAGDPAARARLGQAAWDHVHDHHPWPKVAGLYAEMIEACHDEQTGARTASARRTERAVPLKRAKADNQGES